MIAAFNVLQMIDISKEVDVYETVFELRNIQPDIINNIVSQMNTSFFNCLLKRDLGHPNSLASLKLLNFEKQDLFKNLYSFVKHIMNQPRSILNTGLKTMMERQEEHSELAD